VSHNSETLLSPHFLSNQTQHNKKQNKKDLRKYVEQKQDYQTLKPSGISSSVGGQKLLLSKGHCSKIKGKRRGESKKKKKD
jgi:hypothetical protein